MQKANLKMQNDNAKLKIIAEPHLPAGGDTEILHFDFYILNL